MDIHWDFLTYSNYSFVKFLLLAYIIICRCIFLHMYKNSVEFTAFCIRIIDVHFRSSHTKLCNDFQLFVSFQMVQYYTDRDECHNSMYFLTSSLCNLSYGLCRAVSRNMYWGPVSLYYLILINKESKLMASSFTSNWNDIDTWKNVRCLYHFSLLPYSPFRYNWLM